MGRLDIRLDKHHLGQDLELAIVADVLQIKNQHGNFPDDPFEQEVVIPAGLTSHREVEVPAGTYRTRARLPSGEVMSRTDVVLDDEAKVPVVFETGRSPHEWLSWQRLAGNVPSQQEYEKFLTDMAKRISDAVEQRKGVKIEVRPATIGWAAGKLRQLHLWVSDRFPTLGPPANPASDSIATESDPAPPVVPAPVEFELIQASPADGAALWKALSSQAEWNDWRRTAIAHGGYSFHRDDDRGLTLWRVSQDNRDKSFVRTATGDVPLRCLAALRRGDGLDIALLPVPWPLDPNDVPVKIEILREAGAATSGRTTVVVQDPRLGGLLMYLGSGRIGKAAAVLVEANKQGMIDVLLEEKQENPIAACAAAYVAIASMAIDNRVRWNHVLDRLARFEWLPDGAIIKAAYYLKIATTKADLDEARNSLKVAYARGLPFFTVGLQHLQQGLYSFSEKDAEAKQMHEAVTKVALRIDPDQAFTLIQLTPAGTQG
jgi:hypothetical protein